MSTANKASEEQLLKKRAFLYLGLLFGFLLIGWVTVLIEPNFYNILSLFSFLPLLASLITRIVTKDQASWLLKPNFKRNWKLYLLAGYVPSILILLGAVVYFLIYPNHLDLSATKLIETYGQFGVPSNLPHTVTSLIKIGIGGIIVAPFILPIALFALGEEIGWRGYLLPILMKLIGQTKAVLVAGILWGICHAPLIYFGFNYGQDYWGAPFTGILLMTLVGVVLNVWLSYLTIKTKSIIPATILHGAINLIGEFPAMVAISGTNTLLGPNPTGIIGMSFLLIGSIFLFRRHAKQTSPTLRRYDNENKNFRKV